MTSASVKSSMFTISHDRNNGIGMIAHHAKWLVCSSCVILFSNSFAGFWPGRAACTVRSFRLIRIAPSASMSRSYQKPGRIYFSHGSQRFITRSRRCAQSSRVSVLPRANSQQAAYSTAFETLHPVQTCSTMSRPVLSNAARMMRV